MTKTTKRSQKNPILASTIMPIREGEKGLQVFMAVRSKKASFIPGAWVFPGGKIEESDRPHLWKNLYDDEENFEEDELQIRIGALRELFEETGFLLARKRTTKEFVKTTEQRNLVLTLKKKSLNLRKILEENEWILASSHLVFFAHWITPKVFSKRYDTHFYLAVIHSEQELVHDGMELTDSGWFYPQEMLELVEKKVISMIFPTKLNLMRLGQAQSVAEALQQAKNFPKSVIMPELIEEKNGLYLQIPQEANYPITRELFRAF